MAVYACDYDRRRYRQAQQSIYWTEVSEHVVSTYKLRLCPEHFEHLVDIMENRMTAVEDAGTQPDNCEACGGERLFSISARVFAAHKDEQQYVTDLCAADASRLGNELHVYNGSRL